MNKKDVINKLAEKTGYTEEQCEIINGILESNFIIGKKNKEKIIADMKAKLNLDDQKAEELYEKSMEVIGTGLKDKLLHPFGKQ